VRESEQRVREQARVVEELERRGNQSQAAEARAVLESFRKSLDMARARLRIERSVHNAQLA
jgi:hypothetical protein